MISTLPLTDKLTYHDLLEVLVCNTESKSCMLHRCDNCPGISALQLFIESKLKETMLEKDESVKFKQWTSTDRVTINEEIKPLSDCSEILVEDIVKLSVHHYIARNQSNYIKHLKEIIKPNEAIITFYFAENYSFVIQYAVQGFHWNNSQATLHPFVVYYRGDEDLLCNINFCVISNCFKHYSVAVHSFIDVVLQNLT